jgi:hypothetical protein
MAVVTILNSDYHIDDKLKKRWDLIKDGKLTKADEDRVYVVDGREGCGKSLFTLQQAAYIDPSIVEDQELSRITFSTDETLEAIRKTKSTPTETKAIVFDEAFRGLSSRAALSKNNRKVIQALMEMRQNNLVLFIVLPSYFMLDLYPAVSRSNALFHIAKKKGTKLRSFHVYNYQKKAKLYDLGIKKGWSYKIYTAFKGRFTGLWPGGEVFKQRYIDKKQKSLQSVGDIGEVKFKDDKFQQQRDILVRYIVRDIAKTYRKAAKLLKELGVKLSAAQLHEIDHNTTENTVN